MVSTQVTTSGRRHTTPPLEACQLWIFWIRHETCHLSRIENPASDPTRIMHRKRWLFIAFMGAAAAAHAADGSPRPFAGNAPAGNSQTHILDRATTPDMPSTSKTVELLLQIDGSNPNMSAGDRAQAARMAVRAADANAGAKAFNSSQSGLASMVTETAPDPGAQQRRYGWGPGHTAPVTAQPGPMPTPVGRPIVERGESDSTLRNMLRAVRDHREWLLAAGVLLLALAWAASASAARGGKSSRSRR